MSATDDDLDVRRDGEHGDGEHGDSELGDAEQGERSGAAAGASGTEGAVSIDHDGFSTLVIEDGVIPRRVRRPGDLLRFAIAILAFVVLGAVSYFLTNATSGIDQDLVEASNGLPDFLVLVVNLLGGIGVLLLPVAASVDLLFRRRGRQLVEAFAALAVAIAVAVLLVFLAATYGSSQLLVAITGVDDPTSRFVLSPITTGLVAFITVARLLGRGRFGWLAAAVVVASAAASLISGAATTTVLGLSILLGWAVGLATRYTLGTPTTRPSGVQVADALDRAGFPLTMLRAARETRRGRQYSAHARDGERLRVIVFDRDLEGAGIASAVWRQLRLRTDPGNPGGFSMRAQLEHAALMSYAATAAGSLVPGLRVASEVGPDSTLLAYDHIEGVTFADVEPETVTDVDLEGMCRVVRRLHDERIVHRALSADQFLKASDGRVWLAGIAHGTIAAGDVMERIDLAELLCTMALLTDAPRAIAAGAKVFGADRLVRALPALQLVALSRETRKPMRRNKKLLVDLRDELIALRPSAADTEQLELRRVKPRTLLTVVAGSVAVYVLAKQLGGVDIVALFKTADWRWALVALVLSVLTFVGASLSLSGFVPESLSHVRTFAAQLAAGFATLVSPPTIGAVAVNVRYLQRSGLHPALAAASVGVSQVFAFFIHIGLLFVTGLAAGRSADLHLTPSRGVLIGVGAVLLVLLLLLALGPVRKIVADRVRPILSEVGPRLLTVAQRPWKIVEGVGGILLLNGAFALCMIACCEAFGAGGNQNWAAIAFVYLAGSTLGQAAPTPGGLGAVEAAYIAGLQLAGVDSGIALSATLLFRLLTFWLPTAPGYWAFNWLQKVGSL